MEFAAADIISGKLFDVECKYCGHKTRVNYPILFNDMEHDVMIYYVSDDADIEDIKKDMFLGRWRYRFVYSQESLREKASIFQEGLDDRVIEIYKVLMGVLLQEQHPSEVLEGMYFLARDGEYQLEILMKSGGVGHIAMNMDLYRDIEKKRMKLLRETDDSVIDQAWAMQVIRDDNSEE